MQPRLQNFEEVALPHLGAAYNLARWLAKNDTDAEDVVQEAYLRAYRHFGSFHGGDGRPWLLAIVRNTFYTWLRHNRPTSELQTAIDDEMEIEAEDHLNPETLLLRAADNEMLRQGLEALNAEFREVIVLRELEGLSYKEIAQVAKIPVGTVMSRLARARKGLQRILRNHGNTRTRDEVSVGAS